MRHKNSVKQLGKTHSHRKAMFENMVTSFFINEKIITTKQKGKELKKISEKLITKAKKNINLSENESGTKLHNKRLVMKTIKNRDVVRKLFDDIALRNENRNGGYTRLSLLGRRSGDAAEMAIIELVEKKATKSSDESEKIKATKDKKKKKNKIKEKE